VPVVTFVPEFTRFLVAASGSQFLRTASYSLHGMRTTKLMASDRGSAGNTVGVYSRDYGIRRPQLWNDDHGEIASVDVLLLLTPRKVTTSGRFPAGKPSGNLTIMYEASRPGTPVSVPTPSTVNEIPLA
jgi:hypothetical protein